MLSHNSIETLLFSFLEVSIPHVFVRIWDQQYIHVPVEQWPLGYQTTCDKYVMCRMATQYGRLRSDLYEVYFQPWRFSAQTTDVDQDSSLTAFRR